MRPSASRNQRNKGLRVKYALQLFLLAAICVWLLYQLKHSYEKKRLIEETTAKMGDREADAEFDLLKLGRKDLVFAKTHDKEEESEETEEKQVRDSKQENSEQVRGAGQDEADEIDDQDQEEKVDEEGENVERFDYDANGEDEGILDEEEHDEGSQEAREEHYKRDDASSAVRHDIQMTESEFTEGDKRNQNNEEVGDITKQRADGENGDSKERVYLERMSWANETDNASMGNNDSSSENVNGSKLDIESLSNSTPLVQDLQNEVQANSASVQSNNPTGLLSNLTHPSTREIETQNKSLQVKGMNYVVPLKNEYVSFMSSDERNDTVIIETPSEVNPNMADVGLQQIEKSEASEQGNGARTESDTARENGDAAQSELDAKRSENGDDSLLNRSVQKEANTDVSILHEIQHGANGDKDEASE